MTPEELARSLIVSMADTIGNLIRAAVFEEREACANVAEGADDLTQNPTSVIAAAIRERSNP